MATPVEVDERREPRDLYERSGKSGIWGKFAFLLFLNSMCIHA